MIEGPRLARRRAAGWIFLLALCGGLALGLIRWRQNAERDQLTFVGEPLIVTIGRGQIQNAIAAVGSLQVSEPGIMTVESEVFETDIATIAGGVEAYVVTDRTGDRRWYGSLREIQPQRSARGAATVYRVVFDVENADGALSPGMNAQVFFVTSAAEGVLTVPVGALRFEGQGGPAQLATVEVELPNGELAIRDVVVGAMDRVSAEVITGLEEGDRVVAGFVLPEVPRDEREDRRPSAIEDRLFESAPRLQPSPR